MPPWAWARPFCSRGGGRLGRAAAEREAGVAEEAGREAEREAGEVRRGGGIGKATAFSTLKRFKHIENIAKRRNCDISGRKTG